MQPHSPAVASTPCSLTMCGPQRPDKLSKSIKLLLLSHEYRSDDLVLNLTSQPRHRVPCSFSAFILSYSVIVSIIISLHAPPCPSSCGESAWQPGYIFLVHIFSSPCSGKVHGKLVSSFLPFSQGINTSSSIPSFFLFFFSFSPLGFWILIGLLYSSLHHQILCDSTFNFTIRLFALRNRLLTSPP